MIIAGQSSMDHGRLYIQVPRLLVSVQADSNYLFSRVDSPWWINGKGS
jgi:hypothetical protein